MVCGNDKVIHSFRDYLRSALTFHSSAQWIYLPVEVISSRGTCFWHNFQCSNGCSDGQTYALNVVFSTLVGADSPHTNISILRLFIPPYISSFLYIFMSVFLSPCKIQLSRQTDRNTGMYPHLFRQADRRYKQTDRKLNKQIQWNRGIHETWE